MSTEILFLKDDNIPEIAKETGKPASELEWMLDQQEQEGLKRKVMITVEHRDNVDGFGT